MKKENEEVKLSEIDEKLMNDTDGSFKKELIAKLEPYKNNLNQKIAKGEYTPEEFEVAKTLQQALKQADAMLRDDSAKA